MKSWMTRQEAADHLRYKTDAIDTLARQGKIARYRLDGKGDPRFLRDELDALMLASFQPKEEQ